MCGRRRRPDIQKEPPRRRTHRPCNCTRPAPPCPSAAIQEFSPYGYDERQYCSPAFNLPVGLFQRSQYGPFPNTTRRPTIWILSSRIIWRIISTHHGRDRHSRKRPGHVEHEPKMRTGSWTPWALRHRRRRQGKPCREQWRCFGYSTSPTASTPFSTLPNVRNLRSPLSNAQPLN